jgi:YD repeat-containing protein
VSSTNNGTSVTQYGVQTPNSSTVLVVTTDRAEAEHALDWITDGRVVQRTITYGGWQPGADEGDLALTG